MEERRRGFDNSEVAQRAGRKGGKAKVKKGFAMLSKDKVREIAQKGGKESQEVRKNGKRKPIK